MNKIYEIINLLIFMTVIYFIFTNIGIVLFIFLFFCTIVLLLLWHMMYVLNKVDWINKNLDNNLEFAKATFRWNFLARIIFYNALNHQDTKTISKLASSKCFKYYLIETLDNITISDIKKKWKELAKIYHPDKMINNMAKNEQQQTFIEITKCRDELIAVIKKEKKCVVI